MRLAIGLLHVGTGIGYLVAVGILPLWDQIRIRRAGGRLEMFALALVAMAFTCGPHHLILGAETLADRVLVMPGIARYAFFCHLGARPHVPGCTGLDLITVLVAFPPAAVWTFLRMRALLGGNGDHLMWRTPLWLRLMPAIGIVYAAALVTLAAADFRHFQASRAGLVLIQVSLAILYCLIGYWLISTQLINHDRKGWWSLSGLSLGAIFPTCAASHLAYAYYRAAGSYRPKPEIALVDVVGIGVAAWFCWIVYSARKKASA